MRPSPSSSCAPACSSTRTHTTVLRRQRARHRAVPCPARARRSRRLRRHATEIALLDFIARNCDRCPAKMQQALHTIDFDAIRRSSRRRKQASLRSARGAALSSACASLRSANPIHVAAVGKEHPAVQREPAQLPPPAQRAAVRRLLPRRGAGMCELVCAPCARRVPLSSVHLTMDADSATDCPTASYPAPWCDWKRRRPLSQTSRASCWPR